jgi:hypothetical protein
MPESELPPGAVRARVHIDGAVYDAVLGPPEPIVRTGVIRQRDSIAVNPDCAAGKHAICDGLGWDTVIDDLIDCPYACHDEGAGGA